MRILHLLKSTTFSGAENVVLTLIQLFPEHDAIYASPDGPIQKKVAQQGVVFYPLEGYNLQAVKKVIHAVKPDLIHAHDFSMATNAAWVSNNIPVIAHLHNNPPWIRRFHPKTIAFFFALPRIAQVISVSSAIQKEALFGFLMASKNTVIGNIIDLKKIETQAQANGAATKTDLVFLGRFSPQKRPILFCQIVQCVKKKRPEIKARMIGTGELESAVKKYIALNQLEDNIELIGFKNNPYPYLAAAKIQVMPSAWEGFGLAAVEGLSLGKPVLCSGVGGLAEIVDASCGAICNTVQEYTNEICKLISSKQRYQQKSRNAAKRVCQFANSASYKNKIEAVYAQIL